MKHIMLDLETMGTGGNAAIIAVGAVAFDITTRTTGSQFYQVISLESAVAAGGVIDPQTVMWWMLQDDRARGEFSRKGMPIEHVLEAFQYWCNSEAPAKELWVWGNGSDFDNKVLSSAYARAGINQPWQYRNSRCYRTIRGLYPEVDFVTVKTAHIAVEDAMAQTLHLFAVLDKMGYGVNNASN